MLTESRGQLRLQGGGKKKQKQNKKQHPNSVTLSASLWNAAISLRESRSSPESALHSRQYGRGWEPLLLPLLLLPPLLLLDMFEQSEKGRISPKRNKKQKLNGGKRSDGVSVGGGRGGSLLRSASADVGIRSLGDSEGVGVKYSLRPRPSARSASSRCCCSHPPVRRHHDVRGGGGSGGWGVLGDPSQ